MGQVGLSGFTLYPNIINYLENRELVNLNKKILNYFFSRIENGHSIEEEFPMSLMSFILSGCELHKLTIDKYSLSCVPKFLFRSLTKLSIHDAQVSLAKECDENTYKVNQFTITSCFALLVFAYKHCGLTNFIKNAAIELADAYTRTLSIIDLASFNFKRGLMSTGESTLYNLLRYKQTSIISRIADCALKEDLNHLASKESDELIRTVSTYGLNYIYKLEEYSNLSYAQLNEKIKENYFRFICPSYTYLLDKAGKYYDEMIHLNIEYHK